MPERQMRKADDIIAREFGNGAPSQTFLNHLNSVSVSKEDIFEVVIEGIREYREGADPDPGLRAMARLYASQPQRAPAVYFRLQALTRFLKQKGPSDGRNRWLDTGSPAVNEALFAAAADHPLAFRDEVAIFEPESFLTKILELVEPMGLA